MARSGDKTKVKGFQFLVKPDHRKKSRRVVVKSKATLAELDSAIRNTFGYDTWDHCSGFWEAEAYSSRTIAEIYPDGSGENESLLVSQLSLAPGDTMSYVYDFGDNLSHVITLEAAPESTV